jgi:transposase-like protein
MRVARKIQEPCPCCGDDSDVWVFEKDEPVVTKEHYTCEACGCEWTEVRQD